MKIKSEPFKKLIAVDASGKIVDIPNMAMRKPLDVKSQGRQISKQSVCIVCNYTFKDKPIVFSDKIAAVCHPFKDDTFFPNSVEKHLLSESDFYDTNIVWDNGKKYDKKYDFFCFTINSEQGVLCKGLYMLPMLDRAAGKAGLKGVLIDYSSKYETYSHTGTSVTAINQVRKELKSLKNIKFVEKLMSPKEMCKMMRSCRFGLYPNNRDASPRLLVEAIVRNVPVMVNRNIYGGWKYINDATGKFFDAPSMEEFVLTWNDKKRDVFIDSAASAMSEMAKFDNSNTAKCFNDNFGFVNASRHLARIINGISGTDYEMVAYTDFNKILQKNLK